MSLNHSVKFSRKTEVKSCSQMSDQVVQFRKRYTDEAGGSNVSNLLQKKGTYDYVGEDSS